jgi:transglutaminase-like putative cysteine protease
VDLIKRYAIEAQRQPIVRSYAESVVSGLGSKDYLSEIVAVYYAVLASVRYANDPRTVELVRKPALILREIRAGKVPSLDCDDLTTLLAALYLSLGRQVQVVTVAFAHRFFNGQRQYSHVFLRVKEPRSNAWVVVDPVAAEETAAMLRKGAAFRIWPVA